MLQANDEGYLWGWIDQWRLHSQVERQCCETVEFLFWLYREHSAVWKLLSYSLIVECEMNILLGALIAIKIIDELRSSLLVSTL